LVALAEITMFIIEQRTAGVLAALVIPAVVAILSNVWDRVGGPAVQSSAMATAAFAPSVGPGVRPIASAADEVPRLRAAPDVHRTTGGGPSLHAAVRTNRDKEVIRKQAELGGISITRTVEVPQISDPLTGNN
jgi:hypothetical protein